MDQQLLNELMVASTLSSAPAAGQIIHEQNAIKVVVVDGWVLPHECFVLLWFWLITSSKIYSNRFDHNKWDPILKELNSHQTCLNRSFTPVLEFIYSRLKRQSLVQQWSVHDLNVLFNTVIDTPLE